MDKLTAWFREYSLLELNNMGKGTIGEVLGIQFEEIGNDYLVASMPVDERTFQPYRLLHGGASVVLSETLGSVASLMCVNENNLMPVGVEVNANHLASATSGRVKGICRPVKIGGRLHVWETRIENENNQLICVSRLTTMIIPRR